MRVETALRPARLGVSPHAPYTCALELYQACAELGLPQATHFAESEAERDWLVNGAGDWRRSPTCSSRRRVRPASGCSRPRGCSTRA